MSSFKGLLLAMETQNTSQKIISIFPLEVFGNVHLEVIATASPVIICCTHTGDFFGAQDDCAVLPHSLLCACEFRISGYTVMGKQTVIQKQLSIFVHQFLLAHKKATIRAEQERRLKLQ